MKWMFPTNITQISGESTIKEFIGILEMVRS